MRGIGLINKMGEIELTGIELLTNIERATANKLINEYYKKIQRELKDLTTLKVHIKEYGKKGDKKKYSINVQTIIAKKVFQANAFDWDFARTLHKVMKNIENEIENRLHSSDQHKAINYKERYK